MDTQGAYRRFEAFLTQQMALSAADPAVSTAARALLSLLESGVRQLSLDLAQQAAIEVQGQVPGLSVDVLLALGEPSLRVSSHEETSTPSEAMEARLTLRLPRDLKTRIDEEAARAGESVNTWVVKALSARSKASFPWKGRRIQGSLDL